jgi:hypothetical protein
MVNMLLAGLLPDLTFYPEDRGSMFLGKDGDIVPSHNVLFG